MNTCQAGGPTLAISPDAYKELLFEFFIDLDAGRAHSLGSYLRRCPGRELDFIDHAEGLVCVMRADITDGTLTGEPAAILHPQVANGVALMESQIAAWRFANPDAEDTQTEDDDQ